MGDVVIRLVLEDKGLLPDVAKLEDALGRRPDVFVISAGKEDAEARLPQIVAQLRSAGLHVRHSYKATRNVGKLLGDAGKANARYALILGDELARGCVVLKELDSQQQTEIPIEQAAESLRARLC
jgi:histidyl-tRNA synthetase